MLMLDNMKKCSKCGNPRPATTEYFFARTEAADGLQPLCKTCRTATRADRQTKETSTVSDDPFMRPASSLPQPTRKGIPLSQRLTKTDARKLVNEIKAAIANTEKTVKEKLLQLWEAEAWKPLGYDTWEELGEKEFKACRSYTYKLMAAAKPLRNLSTIVDKFPEIKGLSDNALIEIGRLEDPDEQITAASLLIERARGTRYTNPKLQRYNGVPTAAMAAKVVNLMKAGGDTSNMSELDPPMPEGATLNAPPLNFEQPWELPVQQEVFDENEDEDQITEEDVAKMEESPLPGSVVVPHATEEAPPQTVTVRNVTDKGTVEVEVPLSPSGFYAVGYTATPPGFDYSCAEEALLTALRWIRNRRFDPDTIRDDRNVVRLQLAAITAWIERGPE